MIKNIFILFILSINLFGIDEWQTEHTTISKKIDLQNIMTHDNLISVILLTPVNSHLAGKVVAQVEMNKYANHGDNIIIPKGSKAIGYYKALDTYSQERMVIKWDRIITPGGRNINLTGADTTDATGQSGAVGELDKRYWDRYGLAMTLSTFSNIVNYALIKNSYEDDTEKSSAENEAKKELYKDYSNDTKNITQQILKEQLMIMPIIIIKKGTRLFISPKYDIVLNK